MEASITGYRISPQQRRIWLAAQEAPGCLTATVTISGRVHSRKLQDACRAVVARHESLRTSFEKPMGMKYPLQVISSEPRIAFTEDENAGRPEDGDAPFHVHIESADHGSSLQLRFSEMVADHASIRLVFSEIAHFYANGDADSELPVQYADFSEWQNQLIESPGEERSQAEAFWGQRRANSLHPRLPFETRAGASGCTESIAVGVMDALLEKAAFAAGCDVEDFLATAWSVFLCRICNTSPVVMFEYGDGRLSPELEASVGAFARRLPLRCVVDLEAPFSAIARQVAEERGSASQLQGFLEPDGADDDALGIGILISKETPEIQAAGLCWRLSLPETFPGAKLVLRAQTGQSTRISLAFDPGVVQKSEVERLGAYFLRILKAFADQPNIQCIDGDLLSPEERKSLVEDFNQTKIDFAGERCFHHIFEDQASLHPDAVALISSGQVLRYAEVNAAANRIACRLRASGVNRNAPVGLMMERSAEMIIGLIAILKAGGAYVPLQIDLPPQRLAQIISQTGMQALVTMEPMLPRLPAFDGSVLCLDRDRELIARESARNLTRLNQPSDLVYIIYTSGSTGIPKGVAVRHENLMNYVSALRARVDLDRKPLRFGTVSSISADLGNTSIFPALASGGSLTVFSYHGAIDGDLFGRENAPFPVDVLKITPSNLAALMATGHAAKILPKDLLILGGEASRWDLIDRVKTEGSCAVMNHYGPTETTIGCLTFPLDPEAAGLRFAATVPVGRPIANMRAYILDARLKPVPMGVAGELYVAGSGVASGYYNDSAQTSERFIPDPWSPGRMYKTGDLTRRLPGGAIEFLGRADQQIKIRGFRVELTDIEAAIEQHPSVRQAGVIAVEPRPGEVRLAAFCASTSTLSVDGIRSFLKERLPEYMIPASFTMLGALPLTPNGKLDRKALLALPDRNSMAPEPTAAPPNPIEEKLLAIWCEVLGQPTIGLQDNFFDVGGHSLLATLVISRMRAVFGVQLPLRTLFETPSIAGLARVILEQQAGAADHDEMTDLLAELEGLSDEEALRLLEKEAGGAL